jgi:hypothetical protein
MISQSNILISIIIFTSVIVVSCEKSIDSELVPRYPPDTRNQVTISQGAWGNVWFWEGDFMPTTNPGGSSGRITSVVRTVYVHELTNLQQVDQVLYSPFYRAIHTNLIDSVQSNSTGFFQVALDTGRYSFFVREDSLYYANSFDGYMNILAVTIKKDSLSEVQIDLTYKATF